MRRAGLITALAVWCAVAAPAADTSPEPRNLGELKQQISVYVSSGDYDRAIVRVAAEACAWLERRARIEPRAAPTASRLAVVMDLDDTLFRNIDEIAAHDFGYDPAAWNSWVERAGIPPLEPVREIYRTARRLRVAVVFLTSRPERQRAATERNLAAIGCGEHVALICQPDSSRATSGAFKKAERKRLANEGWILVANVGDQDSDFEGGGAEREFRIPNPFYLTR